MNTNKGAIVGVALVVIAGLFVPPVQAHRKYRVHYKGLPMRILVRHSHDPGESAKLAVEKPAETKDVDLLAAAAGIFTGTLRTLGNVVEAVCGGKTEPASETRSQQPSNSAARP